MELKKLFWNFFSWSFAPNSPEDADMIWLKIFFDIK